MVVFDEVMLPADPDVTAPDGSDVRILAGASRGTMAEFTLAPGEVSIAVVHRTVEELWCFTGGTGEMWRRDADREAVVPVRAGVSVSIPAGTRFQFRSTGGGGPLVAIAVTMPPWPGDGEAARTEGPWVPTVAAGPGLGEGRGG